MKTYSYPVGAPSFEAGSMLALQCGVLVCTQVDRAKDPIACQFVWFPNQQTASEWSHEASRKQLPKWHQEHCSICKAKGTE